MGYAEQLKNPRWQKRRLEILERDKWTCQACKDTESTLTVHHKSYRFENGTFADVWDYVGDDLITLCESCHQEEEEALVYVKKQGHLWFREFFDGCGTSADMMLFCKDFKTQLRRRINAGDIERIRSAFLEGVSDED
jgi:hypothetical protein